MVVLVYKVGYHCRTLPFATISFDLHALDTPPAFILSQDQTLNEKMLTQWVAHL